MWHKTYVIFIGAISPVLCRSTVKPTNTKRSTYIIQWVFQDSIQYKRINHLAESLLGSN